MDWTRDDHYHFNLDMLRVNEAMEAAHWMLAQSQDSGNCILHLCMDCSTTGVGYAISDDIAKLVPSYMCVLYSHHVPYQGE